MTGVFASADPARLRRTLAGGGHAALSWLRGWRGEARLAGLWRRMADAAGWARAVPALKAGPLWGDALAAATSRTPAGDGAPVPRRRRREHLKPRADRRRTAPPPMATTARLSAQAADLPKRADPALLRRVGAAFADLARTAVRQPFRRRTPVRRTPPPAFDEARLADWRRRLLDPDNGRVGSGLEWAASGPASGRIEPAWTAPIDGPVANADVLHKAMGGREKPRPFRPAGARRAKAALVSGSEPGAAPGTPQHITPARRPPPRAPWAAADRTHDLSRHDDMLDASEPPHPIAGDAFLRLGEIDHRPPAPLGPFALPEETAPRHALPRVAAPDQSPAVGSVPSHAPPGAHFDPAELTAAIEDILKSEARRHGIDV